MDRQQLTQMNLEQALWNTLSQRDIVHKTMIAPKETLLNTYQVDNDNVAIGELPQGMKQAIKTQLSKDSFATEPFKALDVTDGDLTRVKQNNMDNIISYLKSRREEPLNMGHHIELAICVCMYSEDKRMLKDTMKGIEDNFVKMLRAGMNPDSIAVVIMMDGIEKVDESIVSYFDELERESGIDLPYQEPSKRDTQTNKTQGELSKKELESQVQRNKNSFLFNTAELQQREASRFEPIRKQYLENRKNLNKLSELRSKSSIDKGDLYQELPAFVQNEFFYQAARKHKQRAAGSEWASYEKKQEIIDEYTADKELRFQISLEAIDAAITSLNKFFKSREDLSYLGSFRKKIYLTNSQQINGSQSNSYDNVVEEIHEESREMNVFTCVKYKNGGKLSSHSWFFNGFCKQLNPKFTILLDVGLKPDSSALYKMYTHMRDHPKVGGVCGYMRLKIQKVDYEEEVKDQQIDCLSSLALSLVDIQKAQRMEYNLSHIIDKPFESAIGFIHVLPGAFSGYNMAALRSDYGEDKLLKEYFRSIGEKVSDSFIQKSEFSVLQVIFRLLVPQFIYSCFIGVEADSEEQLLYDANVCLAEDRILCMEIHKNGYDLAFLPDAIGQVDPMKTVHDLLGQRKRWMNGSLFAFDKVKREMSQVDRCQILLPMQVAFYSLINTLSYFAIALFGYTFHISLLAFREDVLPQIIKDVPQDSSNSNSTGQMILNFFVYAGDFTYAMIVLSIVFFSVTTTAKEPVFKPYIYFASTMFGLMTIMVFLVLFIDMIRGLASDTAFLTAGSLADKIVGGMTVLTVYRFMVVGMFGLFAVPVLLYSCFFCLCWPLGETLKDVLSFLFYNTTYLIMLPIYSIARIDDISWGTKGLDSSIDKQKKDKQEAWKKVKLIILAKFVFWNSVAAVVLISFANDEEVRFYLTFGIIGIIVLTILIKVLIGGAYLIMYRLTNCCSHQQPRENLQESELSRLAANFKQNLEPQFQGRVALINQQRHRNPQVPQNLISGIYKYRKNLNILHADERNQAREAIGRSTILQKRSQILSHNLSFRRNRGRPQ